MIDCSNLVETGINELKNDGYMIYEDAYEAFKCICDDIMMLRGVDIESMVVSINKDNNTISIKIGTFFMEIEDMNHDILKMFKYSLGFDIYAVGKGTDSTMLVIDIKFPGFWKKVSDDE